MVKRLFQTIDDLERFINSRDKLGIKLGLERMNVLLKRLSHPEKDIPMIHVAGTNGKGSVIQFIANSLIANQYDVGVFTSPSFFGLNGHYLLNDKPVDSQLVIEAANKLFPQIEAMDQENLQPTSFEIITALAFLIFKERCDIVIIETGMGGKLDTTNCIDPIISVITTIAFDHKQFLGDTLTSISEHKAGIIKPNRPVITGNLPVEARNVVRLAARKHTAPIFSLSEQFTIEEKEDTLHFYNDEAFSFRFKLHIKGNYQKDNVAIAMMVLYYLHHHLQYVINWTLVQKAINEVNLPGRFEMIKTHPPIVLDSAHNVAAIEAFIETVQSQFNIKNPTVLFAGFKDKDLQKMIALLHENSFSIKVTTFDHPRAQAIDDYKKLLGDQIDGIQFVDNWQEEIKLILQRNETEHPLFVTGSLQFIIYVRHFIKQIDN